MQQPGQRQRLVRRKPEALGQLPGRYAQIECPAACAELADALEQIGLIDACLRGNGDSDAAGISQQLLGIQIAVFRRVIFREHEHQVVLNDDVGNGPE